MGRGIGIATAAIVVVLAGSVGSAAAAPAWLAARAPFGPTESAQGARSTMTPDGTVISARVVPTERKLQVNVRPPAGDFGPSRDIDSAVGPGGFNGVVLVPGRERDGAALVYEKAGEVLVSFHPPGGTFGAPLRLSGSAGLPTSANTVVDGAGRVWFVHTNAGSALVASVLGPGGGAPAELPIDAAPPGSSFLSSATVAVAPNDQLRVAYEISTTTVSGGNCTQATELREADGDVNGFVASAKLASTTGFGTYLGICSVNAGTRMGQAGIAVTSDGATTVVYSIMQPDSTGAVVARHRPAGGSWPSAESSPEMVGAGTYLPQGFVAGAGATPVAAIQDGLPSTVAVASRAGDGTWTAPRLVGETDITSPPALAASPSGSAVVAWKQDVAPFRMLAVVRSAGGELSPVAEISPAQDEYPPFTGAAMDDEGNAVVAWSAHTGVEPTKGFRGTIAGFDGAGPRFTSLDVPASGAAGQSLGFSASALDVWSAVGPPSWRFGDGGSAAGDSVTHSFADGSYEVTASVADALGNTTSARRRLSVSPAEAAVAVTDVDDVAPLLGKVRVKPKKARRGKAPRLTFTLSEPATVRATIARKARGVRKAKRCVKPPRHPAKGRRCRRLVTVKTLTAHEAAGPHSLTLPKKLKPGGYLVTLLATDGAGNPSAPATGAFRVVDRR
jgi:hypothetical protein